MIRTVIPFTLFALLSACGQSIPTQSDGPVAKTASDQPGGLLVGTWLRVGSVEGVLVEFQQETPGTLVDSLIIMPRDGVAYELIYRKKTIKLEGWDQIDENACTETNGIDDYVECLMQKAPTKNLYANGWGRFRIQEDNGRGHIRYDQWQDHYSKGDRVADDYVRIFHDKRFIVWDDRLILWDGEDEEILFVRSAQ